MRRLGVLLAAFLLMLSLFPQESAAQIPVSARYFGQLTAGISGVNPAQGDKILLVYEDDRLETVAIGSVIDSVGNYDLYVTVDSSQVAVNGSVLMTLLYRQGNKIYELVPAGSSAFNFAFFATPGMVQVLENLTIGDLQYAVGTASSPVPPQVAFDMDGDGKFNRRDIQSVAAAAGKGMQNTLYDINEDGRVTTKDVIFMMRKLRDLEHQQRQSTP